MLESQCFENPGASVKTALDWLITHPWKPADAAQVKLLTVTSWCCEQLNILGRRTTSREHPLITGVRKAITGSSAKPPSVGELAKHVGISPNYLSSLFHLETGQTLRRFIDADRAEKAKPLLTETRKSIKQIAYGLGFADPSHFSHVFRRVVGISPSAFRDNNG